MDGEIIKSGDANNSIPPRELMKALAMDIGKEVAHRIEVMYPEAVEAASSTFLLSVRNCVHNEIMAAIESSESVVQRIEKRENFRKYIRGIYRNIRRSAKREHAEVGKYRAAQ